MFRACLCFEFVFRVGFLFRAWVSVCGFDIWVAGFGFGGFRRLAVVDFVAVGLFCGGYGFGDAVLVPWWWLCCIFFFLL